MAALPSIAFALYCVFIYRYGCPNVCVLNIIISVSACVCVALIERVHLHLVAVQHNANKLKRLERQRSTNHSKEH